jgi:flagellar motor switch protein FliN
MTIKKPDPALETAAELFLTAFNGKLDDAGALQRTTAAAENGLDPQARWFRQTFTGLTNFELCAGISSGVAETLPGELPALIDDVFQTMARALGTVAGSVVTCGVLTEETAAQGAEIAYELCRESICLGRVILAVPELALSFLGRVIHRADSAMEERSAPRHLDTLMNIDLPVRISFGTIEMALADVLRLTTGSIVEFNHLLSEPVNIIVNNCLVARGDVVVVDANYGVRISEVITRA